MSNLILFKSISNFINELEGSYGKEQHSLVLYNHLINKTTIVHDKPIQKHAEAWKKFCMANRDAILEKNIDGIVEDEIIYSEKVRINVKDIFDLEKDNTVRDVIWSHLLTILALIDPTSNARKILKQGESSEADFLTNIINKVEQNVDVTDAGNPIQAINDIMTSGVFQEIVGDLGKKLDDGSLDVGKLVGSVQNIVSQQPEAKQTIDNIMGMTQGMSQQSGGMDPSMLMNMMNMMMQPPQPPSTLTDTIDK